MAVYPTVLPGSKLLLLVGDGADPEVFAQPCGLKTRSFNLAAATNTNTVPACDDPDAAVWETTDISSLSATGSGAGLMAAEAYATWREWFLSTQGKNMQIKLDHSSLGHYEGSFKLTGFNLTGNLGEKVSVDISFKNDGPVVWVDAT